MEFRGQEQDFWGDVPEKAAATVVKVAALAFTATAVAVGTAVVAKRLLSSRPGRTPAASPAAKDAPKV